MHDFYNPYLQCSWRSSWRCCSCDPGRWFVLQVLWALSKMKGPTCSPPPPLPRLGPSEEKSPERERCPPSSSTPVLWVYRCRNLVLTIATAISHPSKPLNMLLYACFIYYCFVCSSHCRNDPDCDLEVESFMMGICMLHVFTATVWYM